ncbi:P-loop containing nucleoside triphosphate hydrolase [Phytophthora cactorum]|nr:P-loop containing nucleoside triphosphate hydrolase [Phytophthora cactorum]
MNGYLRSKCSSEQQLLNELAKLLSAKDVASRKMADVLRALTFFYTSAGRGSRIPLSLLSGLCTLLPQLKDKKEITLLKDEHQRIARIALCLLTRLIDQFEIQKDTATRLTDSQKMSQGQSVDPVEQVLANFLLTLETAVMTPSGLLLPRQRATLRVYAQICRVFSQERTAGYLHCGTAAAVAEPDQQVFVANKLAQLTFMIPAGTASRHAAKTLLSLLTSSLLNEDRPSNAVTVAKVIELYLLKARPRTLLGGDTVTSVYLLHLCGQMFRLPVHQLQQQQETLTTNDSGVFNINSTQLETSSDSAAKQSHDQNPALEAAVADDPTTRAAVVPAVLLVAVEEALRGTSPENSFRKQPSWGSKCVFELVATALVPLLPAPQDPAGLQCSTVTLHRVCRAVQFVAERLDAALLHLGVTTGQKMEISTYLSQLSLRVHSLTEHSNAFVACEALRAFVWLLPRYNSSAELNGSNEDHWKSIFWQLETLPFDRIQPERRAAIAWTLFRRCVTTLKSYGYEVEKPLLLGCLRVVLAWFQVRPCVWHAALLTAIWHTALRECLHAPLGEAVFSSINEVLDYQCPPADIGGLVVKQSTLQFLSNREGCLKHAVQCEAWCHPLILRLTKQALLETSTSQRMSIRALSQLRDEAHAQGLTSLAQEAKAILSFAQTSSRQARQKGLTTGDEFQNQPFTIRDDPLSDASAEGRLDDPFSDFRAPDGAIASKHVVTTANRSLDDPFADPIESATASDVFSWNDATTKSEVTATVSTSISDFKMPADHSFDDSTWYNPTVFNETKVETLGDASASPFSGWGDESTSDDSTTKAKSQLGKTEDTYFGNFSASETTVETGFAGWGEGGTSGSQQEGFISKEDFSGSFDAAISTPVITTESGSDHAGQTEQSDDFSLADVPVAHNEPGSIVNPDTVPPTGTVSDAQSEAANFSASETTVETGFAGWGEGGTSGSQQEGFISKEDFSGSFDAAISTPVITTESGSDHAGQTEQSDDFSLADVPVAHNEPGSIVNPDTVPPTGTVSDAQSEAANFSASETTVETGFAGWGEGGTSGSQQEGFISKEDFSGSFDAAISTPVITTESGSDHAGQTEQSDDFSLADVPVAHNEPGSIVNPDTVPPTGTVSDAQSEAANFSASETTVETGFAGWGEGGTSGSQQEGFISKEDFSGSFDAAISTPVITTESGSDHAGQTEQSDDFSLADVPVAHNEPGSIVNPDTVPPTGTVSDAQSEAANFSASETTVETGFAGWGEGGTSGSQQEGFISKEDFSGSFDAAISTPVITTESGSDHAGQTEQSDDFSLADVPVAHNEPGSIVNPDTVPPTGTVSDAQSEAANFSASETTVETGFAGWGEGGTSGSQQEGFISKEDFSGSFDAAISTPVITTESGSDHAGQTEQSDDFSLADVPVAHNEPGSIVNPDTVPPTGTVSDGDLEFNDIFGVAAEESPRRSVEFQNDDTVGTNFGYMSIAGNGQRSEAASLFAANATSQCMSCMMLPCICPAEEDAAMLGEDETTSVEAASPSISDQDQGTVEEETDEYGRPHQVEGVQFLHSHVAAGRGCILADYMGLGKTLQVITVIYSFIVDEINARKRRSNDGDSLGCDTSKTDPKKMKEHDKSREDKEPRVTVLVLCPAICLPNWDSEFHKWLGAEARARCPVLTLDSSTTKGTTAGRLRLLQRWKRTGGVSAHGLRDVPWVVESYNDAGELCYRARCIYTRLLAYGFSHHGNYQRFSARDGQKLIERLQSVVLRRGKALLRSQLPPKMEWILYCKLSPVQHRLYCGFLDFYGDDGATGGAAADLLTAYAALLQVMNHPDIIYSKLCPSQDDGSTMLLEDDEFNDTLDESSGWAWESDERLQEKTADCCSSEAPYHTQVLENSGKMAVLLRIVEESFACGDKVVVFSQSVPTLKVISDFLRASAFSPSRAADDAAKERKRLKEDGPASKPKRRRIAPRPNRDPAGILRKRRNQAAASGPSARKTGTAGAVSNAPSSEWFLQIDGSTNGAKRMEYIQRFSSADSSVKLLLVSTRAGAEGINLHAANRLVLFDVSWNPSNDHQSMCRSHRIGQAKTVHVYRLVSTGTMERMIYEQQMKKVDLSTSVVDSHERVSQKESAVEAPSLSATDAVSPVKGAATSPVPLSGFLQPPTETDKELAVDEDIAGDDDVLASCVKQLGRWIRYLIFQTWKFASNMTMPKVGVDITAHKEERNVTDTKKKTKLRVRYYVELVVGSPRGSHTRLGFSGSFQALLRLHHEFVRLYVEKHGEPHTGLLTGRESFLSNSSSTSRSSVSSTSKSSPTSLSSLVRHTFGLKMKSKSTGDNELNGEGVINNPHTQHTHHHHHHRHQYPATQEPPGIVPFPAQNKILVHLESGEANDDDKIEARNAALFGYYSQLFNSDDGEMYLELVHQRAKEQADKNKNELVENQAEVGAEPRSSHSSGGVFKLLGRHPKTEDAKSSKHVEFFEPVYVRARGKSRGRKSTRRNSSLQAP